MPGDYSDNEVRSMTPEDLYAAASRGWIKPVTDPADLPVPVRESVTPAGDVWSKRKSSGDVFVCPSGQTCRLRQVTPDALMSVGILDKVTRLEGLAAKLVHEAEGHPPVEEGVPSREDFAELLSVINSIVPIAVAEPKVLPDPAPGEAEMDGALYASDIDLEDRLAIMEEALKGIRALDRFRPAR